MAASDALKTAQTQYDNKIYNQNLAIGLGNVAVNAANTISSYYAGKSATLAAQQGIGSAKVMRDKEMRSLKLSIADRYASDTMSFFGSGLKLTGTAEAVSGSNFTEGNIELAQTADYYNSMIKDLQAQAKQGKKSGLIGAITGVVGTAVSVASLFSDERIKENVKILDTIEGVEIVKFNYVGGEKTHYGVIAQQIAPLFPDAVGDKAGYKTVDYSKLPIAVRLGIVDFAQRDNNG